jgi:uncharacterized membrane protein YedE/YeeE
MDESILQPLFGGALIGIASLVLMGFNGAIAGISGIYYSAIFGTPRQWWKVMFLAGLVLGASAYYLLSGESQTLPQQSLPLAIAAGAIVGFGTRLGGGCTSGHGVCGNSRLSKRSFVATVIFMTSGIITVSVIRHVL